LIFPSRSHSGLVLLMLSHDQPQRPSISPRSIARLTSEPPGYPVTSLTLAPNMVRRMVAKLSRSAPAPSPPSATGLASTSAQVLTALACQVAHRLALLVMLPSQVKLRASSLRSPSSGSTGRLRDIVPITVPSLGATENT